MNDQERKNKAKAEAMAKIAAEKRSIWLPRSPLINILFGVLFGVYDYFIGNQSFYNALRAAIFFALFISFVDYCYVYYKTKR